MANCLICDHTVDPFINFGKMPIANGFLAEDQFPDEYFFELKAGFCERCGMVQLTELVDEDRMLVVEWSPRGDHIALTFADKGLFLLSVYGGEPVRLTGQVVEARPDIRWSPDGTTIAFSSAHDIGVVRYIDYERDDFPSDHLLERFWHKRLSYEHDRELRALLWIPNANSEDKSLSITKGQGLNIPVNLGDVIEAIYISPTSPPWFLKLIEDLVRRYGLSFPTRQSSLSDSPIY